MNTVAHVLRRKLIKPKKASLTRPYSTPARKPYLLVGLGNPGSEYQHTRHNIGFLAIEHIAQEHNIKLSRNKFNSVYGGMYYLQIIAAAFKTLTVVIQK